MQFGGNAGAKARKGDVSTTDWKEMDQDVVLKLSWTCCVNMRGLMRSKLNGVLKGGDDHSGAPPLFECHRQDMVLGTRR